MKNLQQLCKADNIYNGGKAANLGEAIRAGFRVPEGISLSYRYFKEFLSENKINYLPEQYMAKGLKLQREIMEGRLNSDRRKELAEQLTRLKQKSGCDFFAVRSSSSAEDSNSYSMAGLFESYLHLSDLEEVEEAIKKCYASLYHDRVLNYLYDNNISFDQLKMGIIIQSYIEGELQGVLFTSDTIHMQEDQLQLSVRRAGYDQDAEKNSSIYSIDKKNGSVTSCHGADISDLFFNDLKKQILSLTTELEQVFGKHLDVEWVYKDNQLYLLQVRPITTFKGIPLIPVWDNPSKKDYIWYGIFENPCKPLMQDILQADIKHQSEGAFETLFRTDTYGECSVQSGYIYVRNIPIEEEEKKRQAYLRKLKDLADQNKCIYHDIILPNFLAYTEKLKQYIGRQLNKEELISFLNLSMEYLTYCSRQHWPAVQANEFLYQFEREFVETYKDKDIQDFYDLISGDSILTRERQLLLSMATLIKGKKALSMMFESCPYSSVLYERLKQTEDAASLFRLMDTYINEYGVCSEIECEELLPTIMERPDYIIENIRKVMHIKEEDFIQNLQVMKIAKEKVKQEILHRLSAAEQEEFLRKVALAEKAFLANDNHNYYVERQYYGYIRLAVRAAGAYLCREGSLEAEEDIFYLHFDEIIDLLEGAMGDREIICKRKAEYELQKHIAAPEVLSDNLHQAEQQEEFSNLDMFRQREEQMVQEKIVLRGVSGLKKRIKGTVYKGLPPILEEEAILVLPHCHCGDIMPVISKIKGLIFEWGTPYDHPAIIARELGIPAVYYVKDAMILIETGDEVELDGYSGEIILHKNRS
jgi:phosphoenolpyruvate synthase/pyruvate phosphate dikinase